MIKRPSVELLCQEINTMATDLSTNDTRSDVMEGTENEEETGNFGSEHESMSSECETDNRNGETEQRPLT
jgi:hypothetical protein